MEEEDWWSARADGLGVTLGRRVMELTEKRPNPPAPFPSREGGDKAPPPMGEGLGRGLSPIPREIWQPARAADLARVRPWADDRLRRMSRQEKHPVHDFLFEYYSFRPAHL